MQVRSVEAGPRTLAYGSRREPRYVVSLPVSVMRFLRFGPSVARGMSLDVSRSGMSVLVCGAPQVGETVVIRPKSEVEAFELLATVRHSTGAKSGFEFYPLHGTEEKAVENWIRQLEREYEVLFPDAFRRFEN